LVQLELLFSKSLLLKLETHEVLKLLRQASRTRSRLSILHRFWAGFEGLQELVWDLSPNRYQIKLCYAICSWARPIKVLIDLRHKAESQWKYALKTGASISQPGIKHDWFIALLQWSAILVLELPYASDSISAMLFRSLERILYACCIQLGF
jgi:hypothetical protein